VIFLVGFVSKQFLIDTVSFPELFFGIEHPFRLWRLLGPCSRQAHCGYRVNTAMLRQRLPSISSERIPPSFASMAHFPTIRNHHLPRDIHLSAPRMDGVIWQAKQSCGRISRESEDYSADDCSCCVALCSLSKLWADIYHWHSQLVRCGDSDCDFGHWLHPSRNE